MRKFKKYAEIKPNHRMNFEMLYYHAIRALKTLEEEAKKECGLSQKSTTALFRLQHKLEQMVARWKAEKPSGPKHYILIAKDGQTFDNTGKEIENCQILDFIEAKDINKTQQLASAKNYGNFEDVFLIEYKRYTR